MRNSTVQVAQKKASYKKEIKVKKEALPRIFEKRNFISYDILSGKQKTFLISLI